jgi:hypothetical protein
MPLIMKLFLLEGIGDLVKAAGYNEFWAGLLASYFAADINPCV